MLHKILTFFFLLILSLDTTAQSIDKIINAKKAKKIVRTLSADDMEGRGLKTRGIDKAADFIAEEFKKAGLHPVEESSYFQSFNSSGQGQEPSLKNVVGILPGKTIPDEIIIFSAHYDHLGIGQPNATGDSIYNGANDNASGTAAVILLANYFAKLNNNARTLIFVAFTAEEVGGFGSSYFSKQYNPAKIIAMFNIEMIGTESKWGKNSAFITGYEKSDLGTIMEKNLEGTPFNFYPDPYPQQNLFYRSDNATLARLGVPAHTISTSKMDNEPYYHTPEDEIKTLDLKNMARIIKAIALSSRSTVNGADSPSRVDPGNL